MSKKRKFEWRSGTRFNVPANVAGNELARIAKRDGSISAKTVVDESRPDDAALHPAFEWDDEVAGESWRVYQARNLIRAVVVVQSGEQKATPVYVNVPHATSETAGPGYYDVDVVAERPDMFAIALAELTKKARAAEEAANTLMRVAAGQSSDSERMTKIAIAVEAMHTASSAVLALQ